MLSVQNLAKKYTGQVWAIQDFALTIASNELVCIAGPNGSGKTTIINCLIGVLTPNSGDIHLDGHPGGSPLFKNYIAYVPDELLLIESLTGYEYIDFINCMYGNDPKEKLSQLIELYDMQDAFKQPIETYSHGMKKKTQLIAAFMLKSKLLILDEPFRGLDVEAIIITKKMFRRYLEKDGSILLSTHDLLAAEVLSDKIIILSKGEIIAEGSPQSLKIEHACKDLEEVFMKVSLLKNRSERIEEIIQRM